MHACTHAADVPYAGGAGSVEVSSKLAIDKRPSWPVAAVGLAGARIRPRLPVPGGTNGGDTDTGGGGTRRRCVRRSTCFAFHL